MNLNQESIHTIREKSKKKTPQMGNFLGNRLQLDSQVRYDNNIKQNNKLLEMDNFMRSVRSEANDQELYYAKKIEEIGKNKKSSQNSNNLQKFGDIGCNMIPTKNQTHQPSTQKDIFRNPGNAVIFDRSFFIPNFRPPQ